jgi:outer membrane receptor protein involved in Fe transport
MTYARIASGYRPGGPNTTFSLGLPPQFSPDKTQNYELGVKGEALDRMMSFDTSVYYIDWKNIQLPLESANDIGYFANGSRAKSEGVELSVELRPIIGTTLAGWISYDDAALTESLPATSTVYGRAGDRLPTSSRFSGNLSSDQKFSLNNGSVGFAGATVSYVGNRYGVFTSTPQRQYYGGYTQLDLHSGVTKDLWTFNLSVINVLDKRAYLAGGVGTADPTAFVVNRPRTIGVNLARTF